MISQTYPKMDFEISLFFPNYNIVFLQHFTYKNQYHLIFNHCTKYKNQTCPTSFYYNLFRLYGLYWDFHPLLSYSIYW